MDSSTLHPRPSSSGVVHETSRNIAELIQLLRDADCDRYLYRGQNGVFGPDGDFTRQIPSVFRKCNDQADAKAAIEECRMRVAWMFNLVREALTRPVDKVGQDWNLHFAAIHLGDLARPQSSAAMLGIAQHYGIPTENIDLTSLDPAAVFATQKWLRIDEAIPLSRGTVVTPPESGGLGFIYRYDKARLLDLGVAIGDLSSGNAGSRPIIQEARQIALDFHQDLELFDRRAYEVFPFRLSRIPYVYQRATKPSPLLNENQRMTLYDISLAAYDMRPIAIRDLVIPRFYLSPHPHNPDAVQAYEGERPDPLLVLGRMIERELHPALDVTQHHGYAYQLFKHTYSVTISCDEEIKQFAVWQRERIKSFRDTPETPELVEIAPGKFSMGTDEPPGKIYADETPSRECSVDYPFAVGKYPVTFAELEPFVREVIPEAPLLDLIEEVGLAARRLPAVAISWHDARAYCDWLTRKTRQTYRLLTEIEWEYVCRAGTRTAYWWGDLLDPWRANCKDADIDRTKFRFPRSYSEVRSDLGRLTPVDLYEPNPWGVHDMHGNIWEWVEDVYADSRTNPELVSPIRGPSPFRALRGGSWMDPPLSLRSAARSWAYPTAQDRIIGFRVAREISNENQASARTRY